MAKVLVIDDDSHFRGIIERIILRSYTYSVRSAASEEEGWEELSRNPYDLVMLDLYIDGKKSWDTLKRIKALPDSPVVIMISCEDLPENAEYARTLGAADFVPKPIDFGRLKSSVDAALERRKESRFGRRAADATRANEDSEVLGLLILADRDNRADTVSALTSSRFRLFETDDPGWAAKTVRKETLDAVLTRMDKDAGPAAQLLASLREEEPGRLRVPVIAITDADPDRILAALKTGADDYITLPFDPRILAAKVEAHVRFRREHERKLKEAADKAVTDALTGLYTSAHFRARLEEEFERSSRYGRSISLALLLLSELDGVAKEPGPPLPHPVLSEVSRILRASLRRSDIVGRYEDNGFAIILPEATSERILARADRLRAKVEQGVARIVGPIRNAACFVGLASLPARTSSTERSTLSPSGEDLLRMARQALCRARMSQDSRLGVFET